MNKPIWPGVRNHVGARLLALQARIRDRQLGIRTIDDPAELARPETDRTRPNMALSYRAIDQIAKRVHLRPTDTLFDVGCGYGRIICYFARAGIARCVGIEIRPELAIVARRNAGQLRGRRCPIEVREGDAADQDYSAATILFLYNPFGAEVIGQVLKLVQAHRDGRPVRIIYANPRDERILREASWLEQRDAFRVAYRGYDMGVLVWQSR
jgi:precorrin-6B methylase 2